MRYGWAYLYEKPPAEQRFAELVRHFEQSGIRLRQPATQAVIRLGDEGDHVISSAHEVVQMAGQSTGVALLFWLGASISFVCRFYQPNGQVVSGQFSLDGLNQEETDIVVESLIHLFELGADNQTALALVVDEFAENYIDFHWDDFALGTRSTPPEWPSVLGHSRDFRGLENFPGRAYDRKDGMSFSTYRRKAIG